MPLPRILCLHGGGTNADIFRAQCRAILARLSPVHSTSAAFSDHTPTFRFVFVEAPFLSAPHPQIVAVFGDHGPFRRWLRWLPEQERIDAAAATTETWAAMRAAMRADDEVLSREGEDGGEWVGVIGFSQGAKIAMSMLWAQERAERRGRDDEEGGDMDEEFLPLGVRLKFGVIIAGRAPIVNIANAPPVRGIADPGELSSTANDWPRPGDTAHMVQTVPTLHVHGLQDQGLNQHRRLLKEYCAEGTASLVEWDGGHRLPIRTADVEAVVEGILEVARRGGVDV